MNKELINKKLEHWENQLLDLGKRNKMISFRETKRTTLKILEPEFNTLYERLVNNEEELTFQKPIDKDSDIRVYSVLSLMDSLSAPVEVRLGDIKTAGTVEESKKTLKDLRNKARLSLDEQGTNILYLVFGFVEWREKGSKGDNWIKSPLILVPVSIVLESLNAPYTLKRYEDDLVVNPTLAYLFERDYGITLPNFEPDDDSLDNFMNSMEELVDLCGWRILRETSLGLVSFLKISMYKDLLNNEAGIKSNPIIQAFAGDASALNADIVSEIDFDHDKEKAIELYQVIDADSSQQDAILLSQKGVSFVMQGPPGTGKSQTITNIIAQGLADGKKILFVSEKMAALEVVHRRLEEVHLADFCLALHSYKANKKDILEQLGQNLNLKHIKVKDEELAKLTRLDVLREGLKGYVEDIHMVIMPLEMSLYEVYGAISKLQDLPDVRISLAGIGDYSKDNVNRLYLLVENLEKTRNALGPKWYKNPWQGVVLSRLSNVQKQDLREKLNTIIWVLGKAPDIIVANNQSVLELCRFEDASVYCELFSIADHCKKVPQKWIGKDLSSEKALSSKIQQTKKRISDTREQLLESYDSSFLTINADIFLLDFEHACKEMRNYTEKGHASEIMFTNCLSMRTELRDYYETSMKLKDVLGKLRETYCGNDADDSIQKLKMLLDVCGFLLKKTELQGEVDGIDSTVLSDYENSIFDIDVETMLDRFNKQYADFFNGIYQNYTEAFIDEDAADFGKRYDDKCDALRAALNDEYTNDKLFEDHSAIEDDLHQLFVLGQKLETLYEKMVETYLPADRSDAISQINIMLNVCEVLFAKKKLQDEIDRLESALLVDCERNIFEIDFGGMLNRFKTDYTGFLRFLKKQYREDIKQLRLGYKNVKKKITNDEAIALLQQLKQRKEIFESKHAELDKAKVMLGVDTFADIDSVLTEQEVNDTRALILDIESGRNKYPNIVLNGIGDFLFQISEAQNTLKELAEEVNKIKSYTKASRTYSQIIADLTHISELEYRDDMRRLVASNKSGVHRLLCDEAIALLQQLKHRKDLLDSKQALLDKVKNLLEVSHINDIDSILTEQEIDDTKTAVSNVEGYRSRYQNIPQTSIEDLLLKLSAAQNTLNVLIEEADKIKKYIKTSKNYGDIRNDLAVVTEYKSANDEYEKLLKIAGNTFTFTSVDADTDWTFVDSFIANVESLVKYSKEKKITLELIRFITDTERSAESNAVREFLEEIVGKRTVFSEFTDIFDDSVKSGIMQLDRMNVKAEKCLEQFDSINAWIDYRDCKADCEKAELADFVLLTEDLIVQEGRLGSVFLKAFYYSWIEKKMASMKTISGFNARIHADNVEKFKELDSHQLPVAQMRIREKLINGMPDKSAFNRTGDEMSVLLHELGKKRKIMPLRKLFRSMPNLLLKLKPCLMMSPLSVSYFLEADTYKFDMVIFDEASQIFPQDAIGAIFRGSQVIIAGDSKQLPPTNFFSASTNNDMDFDSDDEDEDEIISDSILEEATNTIPNRSLLWHYRSRYEDLISFSNKEIYGNNLITFPSSKINEVDTGVEYIYVQNGVYENRCNKAEAEKCVQLIEQHIKKYPKRSLGIIAFSESQQSAIEDAVQEFRKKHYEYEKFFDEEKNEAFFIKNLENVQGDERDTIIFSICYGKNAQGRMYMRFGPLGRQGGERRLNVAVTRAKYNIKLVGSIQPEDIDLDKTKSEGVRMLRSYIEFASRTIRVAIPPKHKSRLYETDIFSESVARFLEERGYKVKRNIGSSDYTVDIAVEHPNIPGAYIAGVECDGDSYQMARTVRDRDHLRSAVMERMGWKMYRVWSTEWIQNEQGAKLKLIEFISEALKNYSTFETISTPKEQKIEIATEEVVNSQSQIVKVNSNNPYSLELYQEGHWRDAKMRRGYDNESQIADRIYEIVRVEQPIHLELLYKRMAGCFGNEKVTALVRNSVNIALKRKMSGEVHIDQDSFITFSDYKGIKVRRSSSGSPDRNIEYIPIKEIEEAMKLVLSGAFGVETATLILETARIFGFEKTGVKIKQRLMLAMESLQLQGCIRVFDGRVQLLED